MSVSSTETPLKPSGIRIQGSEKDRKSHTNSSTSEQHQADNRNDKRCPSSSSSTSFSFDFDSNESSITVDENTEVNLDSIQDIADSHNIAIGRTPSGETFQVPKTHDMVRSLFDPTLKKSYCEIFITFTLLANFGIYKAFDDNNVRTLVFLGLYAFWRCAYNFGIGWVLLHQSNHNTLVNFAKRERLFEDQADQGTLLQRVASMEIKSKMRKGYDLSSTPVEFNSWLLFRQFVDLILMQDFTTYMFLVWCCGLSTQSVKDTFNILDYVRYVFGSTLVLLNLWIKIDAHRVVKDYAWYWGDFFFLQDSELIFDGVFNLFPHPMYSVGYVGYYGFALITESYLVLFASLLAHSLQFVFLLWVEEPHIDKIYGGNEDFDNYKDSEFLMEKTENYIKPLIVFKNFKPVFRSSDVLLLIITAILILSPFAFDYADSNATFWFFVVALSTKVFQSFSVGYILGTQSSNRSWTKLFLSHGLDNVTAFINWQIIYNSSLVLTYATLISLSIREALNGQYKQEKAFLPIRLIIGGFLIALQTWTSSYILSSIGEFGWFYGDFFLTNYSKKTLTKSGIYRYLNNPERFLGIAGVWGLTLITNSKYVFALSFVWSLNVTLFISFVEQPHMIKVYGEQQVAKNVSGVALTLRKYVPRSAITIIDNINNGATSFITGNLKKIRSQSESFSVRPANFSLSTTTANNKLYQIQVNNLNQDGKYLLGQESPLSISWKAPREHLLKDWIGLYKVVNTGGSRTHTRISSMGKWFPVIEDAYDNLSELKPPSASRKNQGILNFTSKLTGFEEGVYEFRYYEGDSHKVLSISQPFEIAIPEIVMTDVDSTADVAEHLLSLINKLISKDQRIESIDKDVDYNRISDFNLILKIIRKSTSFEVSADLIKGLRSLSKISQRIVKAKRTLEELDSL